MNGRVQTCQRVADLILGALAQAVPARVLACTNCACCVADFSGEMPKDGSIWVYVETMGGGAGARPTKDGLDGVHVHVTNTSNLPVEALELEYPLTLLRYELVEGSAASENIAAAWACAASIATERLPRAGRRLAPALAKLGAVGRRRVRTARSRPGQASCSIAMRPS